MFIKGSLPLQFVSCINLLFNGKSLWFLNYMKRYLQYEPFNIYCFEAEEWQHPVHKHNHFEIIFVRSGRGCHTINKNTFQYTAGDVFLLGPEDSHFFNIKESTSFCFIRFMEVFIREDAQKKFSSWHQTIEFLLNAPYQSCGSIVKADSEKEILHHLLMVLLQEYEHRKDSSFEIIMNSVMKAILSVLARNIINQTRSDELSPKVSHPIEELMVFIRQNIFSPENLRVEFLAERFNYSPNYLSIFFRKHTGESLQQYILKYKLKQVENRLQYSSMSVSQISHEFGFSDESHLNKTFRKYYGIPPGAYRAKMQEKQD